jgi:hypothetical protein
MSDTRWRCATCGGTMAGPLHAVLCDQGLQERIDSTLYGNVFVTKDGYRIHPRDVTPSAR